MILYQRTIVIPQYTGKGSIINYLQYHINSELNQHETPIRFCITKTADGKYECELGILYESSRFHTIFNFLPRVNEQTDKFTTVLLIPTGIGAELGGHSGDGGALARFIASGCDQLITHPNVVNASDVNELPENGLYVEGSIIADLLMGNISLQKVRSNRVMLIMDKRDDQRISDLSINTVSTARAAIGIDCSRVVELDKPIIMEARYSESGCAVGRIEGLENICNIMKQHRQEYDSVAFHTGIDVPSEFHMEYLQSSGEMVNPWGGVEAMLTHAVTQMFGVPTAHAPMVKNMEIADLHPGIVDPRIASEAVSSTFLMCVLKGLHKSPRIITGVHSDHLTNADISCLIIPDGCVGLPVLAAMEQGIPVIAVRENKNQMKNNLKEYSFQPGKLFIVDNYLEAAGVMNALKGGVSVESIRRPLADTYII